jgi:hypothetical protein
MGELIKIQREELRPRIVCMHCKKEMLIDLDPFKADITKVMRDKCIHCKKEIVVGILILGHKTLPMLLGCLQIITETINSQNQILGGERQP